ncbi:MAG TPA: hypothetical protein VFI52_05640 [Gemmatimonadaceae bacterium]|nr:hypothetical protein [Gemmatimonadaceae bacterium]
MRIGLTRLRRSIALAACASLGACRGDSTAPSSIEVALSTTTVSIAQGASSTVLITVLRTNFAGEVQLSVEHSVNGLTTTLADAILPAGQSQTTLHVGVGSAVSIGIGNVTVRARGANVSDKTAALTLLVTQAAGYAIAVPGTLQLAPGQSGVINVAIARHAFSSPVTFSVEGLPTGATASFAPNPSTSDASTLTISTGSAAPGSYPITVRGSAGGLTDRVVACMLTIAAPTYSLSLGRTTLTLQQGQSSSIAVALSRSDFTGVVSFSVVGLPAGATASFTPASTDGNSTVLIVNAGAAPAGSSPVTIRANATGLAERAASFTLAVAPAAAPTSVSFQLCDAATPVWAGYQSGAGSWVSLPISASGSYSFSIAGVGGLAFVLPRYGDGARFGYETRVTYASAAELQSFGSGACVLAGAKTIRGSVSGVQTNEAADIALGSSSTTVAGQTGATPAFTLAGVMEGAHDLLATRTVAGGEVARLIIGRGLDPADGSTLPVLDFGSSTALAPIKATATVTGTGVTPLVFSEFLTANGTAALLTIVEAMSVSYSAVPPTSLIAGDLHALVALVEEASGLRGVVTYNRQAGARTLALGPVLTQPTVTSLSTGPFARLQLLIPSQTQYQAFAYTEFLQGIDSTAASRRVSILATADYFNGLPGAWILPIPDLAETAGVTPTWGLAPSAYTNVYFEVDGGLAASAPTTDGSEFRFAASQAAATTSAGLRPTRLTVSRPLATNRLPARRSTWEALRTRVIR